MALKACQEVLLKVKLRNREVPEQQHQGCCDLSKNPQWSTSGDADSIREEDEEQEEQGCPGTGERVQQEPRPPEPSVPQTPTSKQSWLLRLFESKLFDVSMAISYLYKSKEPGVQAYIGNRLFSFPDGEVDFYLPQLLNMYVHMDTDVGDAIRPYLVSLLAVRSSWEEWSADRDRPSSCLSGASLRRQHHLLAADGVAAGGVLLRHAHLHPAPLQRDQTPKAHLVR